MRIPKKKLTADQVRIREDLLEQLAAKGLSDKYYLDLVEDYMYMLVQKDRLQADIDQYGPRLTTVNAKGLPIEKKNDSYDLLLKYNQQQIKLLEYLDLKPSKILETGEDVDDL